MALYVYDVFEHINTGIARWEKRRGIHGKQCYWKENSKFVYLLSSSKGQMRFSTTFR